MEYNFREIEKKWQQRWVEEKTYQVTEDESKQKFYVLNMFPYPSGAGLHVGHPLGYIASDIYARYKRLRGFNVLNPMGYDAYGLPAEQYAIQTGQHPAITTKANIDRYREQLDKIGFSFDLDPMGFPKDVQQLLLQRRTAGTPYPGTDRCIRNLRKRRTQRCLQRRTQLYRQRMESQKRKGTAGNPDELPHRLPRRNDGELVPGTGNRIGK